MYSQQTIITDIKEFTESNEINEETESYNKTSFDIKIENFINDLVENGFIPAGGIVHHFINDKIYTVIPYMENPKLKSNGVRPVTLTPV